jgi:hypothetical protein
MSSDASTDTQSGVAQGQTVSLPPFSLKDSLGYWRLCVEGWYPNRHSQTYFLPPIFFRRQQYRAETFAGQSVLIHDLHPKEAKTVDDFYPLSQTPSQSASSLPPATQSQQAVQTQSTSTQPDERKVAGTIYTVPTHPPAPLPQYQETDRLDGDATERLLKCLKLIGREQEKQGKGGMVVISQLEFRRYMDKQTDPISAAACDNLPRPGPDGEVDALVVHSKCGLIPIELKAVWGNTSWKKTATPQELDQALGNTVGKALKQGKNNLQRLQHATSNMFPVNMTPALVLLYITSCELRPALVSNQQTLQQVRNFQH